MKKTNILKASFVFGIMMLSTAGIVWAVLSDTEVSANNTVKMATLNLQVGDSDPSLFNFSFENVLPGELHQTWTALASTGGVPGDFWFEIYPTNSLEGDNSEAETDVDGEGELDDCLEVSAVFENGQGSDYLLFDFTPLNDLVGQNLDQSFGSVIDQWVADQTAMFNLKIITDACGSEAMGDQVDLELAFHLDQI